MENKNNNYILPASIIVGAVLISGSIIYLVGNSKNTGTQTGNADALKETSQDVILGDPKAPVTLVEYADYQCPYCSRFYSTTEQSIRENYVKSGKVKIVSRNFQFLGPESELAGQAADCAKEQGKFWAYHDSIYNAEIKDGNKENSGNLNKDLFVQIAKDNGLDVNKFTSCYDSGKYADAVKQETQTAASLGVNSTPTIFVNGQMVKGALPFDQFKAIIESALKTAK